MIAVANTKTGIESFSIHNKVCDKIPICKRQQCKKYCYYNKFFRLYKNQNKIMMDNYKATLKDDFVGLINAEINGLNIRYFMIHVCGEFYSQKYFDKWVKIASNNKSVKFFTYTRNTDLDVKRPKNFNLYLSLSEKNDHSVEQHKRFDGITRIRFDKTKPIPKGFVLCKHQAEGLKCVECKLCIHKGNKIIFNKH